MNQILEGGGSPQMSSRQRLFRVVLGVCVLALAVFDVTVWRLTAPPYGALCLELRSDVLTDVQVHFDTGQGFREEESVIQPVADAPDFQTLYFPLPTRPVTHLRIDPLTLEGKVTLRSISVVREKGHAQVRTVGLETVQPMDNDTELRMTPEGLEITRKPDVEGSALQLLPLDRPITMRWTVAERLRKLAVLDGLIFALVAAVAYAACLGWQGAAPRGEMPPPSWRAQTTRWLPDRWTVVLFVLPLAALAIYFAAEERESYYLEARVSCDRDVDMQFYYDGGTGFTEADSARIKVAASAEPQTVRFPITVDQITGLRFDPAESPGTVRVMSLGVRSEAENWLHRRAAYVFDLFTLKASQQIADIARGEGGFIDIVLDDDAKDPVTKFTLPAPVKLDANWPYVARRTSLYALGWLVFQVAARALGRVLGGTLARFWAGLRAAWRRLPPAGAVWLVAAGSVVLSCYPVIFCGKSFASPNFAEGTFQLYAKFPTLPGSTDTLLENGHGTDLGSMAWQDGPYSVVQSRALLRDHELPLWNRYNYAGVPLLGQGQSMFGDPLHCIVLLAGGQAWAWDVKFLLAKLLLAAGVGLVVLTATGSLPAALLLAFSSTFLGFFSYRLNHPAYFSFCYAPWILFAWLRITLAPDWRRALRWGGALILANWCELNSGTAKEAYMQIACLNLCGVLLVLFSRVPAEGKFWRLFGLAGAGGIFCLLASPVLLTFFDALGQSVSNYDARHAWQLQPGMFIGLFDDIFYRQFNLGETHFDPSGNFLLLSGCLFALGGLTTLLRDRVFAAVSLSALLPLSLAFGAVPPSVIVAIPLLGNVAHVDNTFSCVLLIHLFVLAGFGFRRCLSFADRRAWRGGFIAALAFGAVLLGLYFGFAQAAQHASYPFLRLNQEIPRSAFFYTYVATLVLAAVLLLLTLRRLAVRGPEIATVAVFFCCLFLLHWRMGVQLHSPFSRYTPVLPNRVNLLATSPAVDFLHAESAEPFRAVGVGRNLMIGYSGVIGVESISGPDALVNRYFNGLETTGLRLGLPLRPESAGKSRLAALKPFYDLLNVRYYLALPGEAGLEEVPGLTLAQSLDLDVYHNDTVWPRAFFVDRLTFYRGPDQFAAHIATGDGRPFAEVDTAQLRTQPELSRGLSGDQATRTVNPATHYRLTSNGTSFDFDASAPGVVVLTEAFMDHDIVALLNGKAVPVFRVNQAFRGIFVDQPGHYHVSFTYRPRGFTLALCAFALGGVLLCAAAWWLFRRPSITPARAETVALSDPAPRRKQEAEGT